MKIKNFFNICKNYHFVVYCILALLLPDICMTELLGNGFFSEPYVHFVSRFFTVCWCLIIMFFCIYILPRRGGKITFGIISSVFIVFSFCEYIYFKIFGQYFWIKSIVLAGEGAEYLNHAIQQIDLTLVLFTVVEIIFLVLALVYWRKPRISNAQKYIIISVPILAISVTHMCMQPFNESADVWNAWGRPRLVYKNFTDANKSVELSGIYQFTYRDIFSTLFPKNKYNDEDFEKVEAFFDAKGEHAPNDYTGIFKGKNVIAVMMESMDTWMIDETYTPTIHKMMNEGINFANYNAPLFGNGYTFGSEFAFNTGLLTPASAVSAANFSSNSFPNAVANRFKDAGYATNSFHFNNPNFYNRGLMHKQFGYDQYNYFADYGLTGTESELDSSMLDNEGIYNKMIEGKPFYDFIITYSAHLPYTGDGGKLALSKEYYPELVDENDIVEKNNAKVLAADTDRFFAELLAKLEADGILEDTVIIAYTDHYAYGIYDTEVLNELRGDEKPYRVPAFIYAKGIEPVTVTKPMMTIDWAPTIANLFGLETEGGYIGNDIFDPDNSGFALFETWSWLDDKMFFTPSEEEIPNEEDVSRIQENNKRVRDSIEVNDIIVLGDYYKNKK